MSCGELWEGENRMEVVGVEGRFLLYKIYKYIFYYGNVFLFKIIKKRIMKNIFRGRLV